MTGTSDAGTSNDVPEDLVVFGRELLETRYRALLADPEGALIDASRQLAQSSLRAVSTGKVDWTAAVGRRLRSQLAGEAQSSDRGPDASSEA